MASLQQSFEQAQGLTAHSPQVCADVARLADRLVTTGLQPSRDAVYAILLAADSLSRAACWLVMHMVYARHVFLDGRALAEADFKIDPQGHAGGSLNMVPAYAAYIALNALTGTTRSWMMGQGHCVAAIDACNVILGNMHTAHAQRYDLSDAGLSTLVKDFYRYTVRPDGHPESPLGSHVNAHTAGGMLEGGYLGFADLHYVHAPLPGETLVAFLSDGAFEEQRGADWAARWWRADDCGVALPVMIANGRRIDQRSGIMQAGGVNWLQQHLTLNGFSPRCIDGRDPAAFITALFAAEESVHAGATALPYIIAAAPKGYGFLNSGTNQAHGTPLTVSPYHDALARAAFNDAMAALWTPLPQLQEVQACLNNHQRNGRVRERDHALARRAPADLILPAHTDAAAWPSSAMAAIDVWMQELHRLNPERRWRIGNPDELRSNRMAGLLHRLKHRVRDPEPGNDEDPHGAVITALNEEAVVCACLANKAGVNLVVSYEAFAVKMLGAVRQEIIFARHLKEAGRPPAWLSWPLIVTSHTWENGKNEQSHQDPALVETLAGEMSDMVRILYPADAQSAVCALAQIYQERGRIAIMVVAKQDLPAQLSRTQAEELTEQGAVFMHEGPSDAIELVACGSYQLIEMRKAQGRLQQLGVPVRLIYLQEPGRFRQARDADEAAVVHTDELLHAYFSPQARARIFLVHGHPEPFLGYLRRLDLGVDRCRALGYRNHGGTFDVGGMLFANACTYAHVLMALAEVLDESAERYLHAEEYAAVLGLGSPYAVITQPHQTAT